MKLAFMFPGQGAQTVGMGKDIYEEYEEVRDVYEEVFKITGIDVAKLTFNSTMEELSKTENTQIAIATMSLGILEVLKNKGIEADIAVGLSLGEYPALIYGGFLSKEEGMKLLKQRGYLMGNRLPDESYAMAAIIGLESSKIEEACKQVQKKDIFVVPANYNYSDQTVISGTEQGIDSVIEIVKEQGAKRAIKLQTGGPFHTIKLETAKQEYKEALKQAKFTMGNKKVIKNIDGTFYTTEDNIPEILADHIVSPVRFDKAIALMMQEQVDVYVEIGPGRALSGFVKKENKEAKVITINDKESLENAITILKGEN